MHFNNIIDFFHSYGVLYIIQLYSSSYIFLKGYMYKNIKFYFCNMIGYLYQISGHITLKVCNKIAKFIYCCSFWVYGVLLLFLY